MAALVPRTDARLVCLPGMYYVRLTKRPGSVRCRSNIIISVFREIMTREFGMTHGNRSFCGSEGDTLEVTDVLK